MSTDQTSGFLYHQVDSKVFHSCVLEEPNCFLSVYDGARGLIEDRWLFNYNLVHGRSDEDLAQHFAYWKFDSPALCKAIVPAGAKIGYIGDTFTLQNESWKRIEAFRLYSRAGVSFSDERILPQPPYRSQAIAEPHLVYDFYVTREMNLLRFIFAKPEATLDKVWLFQPSEVMQKSPEELCQCYKLSEPPRSIQNVTVHAGARGEAWGLPGKYSAFQFSGSMVFKEKFNFV